MQTNVTSAGECLIDTTQPECAAAWCDKNLLLFVNCNAV